jgi:exopolysaccharide biosynthesis polyprenyl glycosylphosphotransferase
VWYEHESELAAGSKSMDATSADTGSLRSPHISGTVPSGRAAPRSARLRRSLLIADVAAATLAGIAAAFAAGLRPADAPEAALALALGVPVAAALCGLYAADLRSWATGAAELPRLAVAALLLSWPAFAILSSLSAPRPAVGALTAVAVAACAAAAGRAGARIHLHRAPWRDERTLIVGSGEVAAQLLERIRGHTELGLLPIGFVDDDVPPHNVLGIPRLGSLSAVRELVDAGAVDRVVIAFTRSGHDELLQCIRVCRDAGIPVDVVPRLFELLDGARAVGAIGALPLLAIDPPSLSPLASASKRALDVAGALVGLVLVSPLLVGIAIAIKLDSPGPALFVQPRAGRGGRFFRLYKFRSMRADAPLLVQGNGAIVKLTNDERTTRVGRLLRRFSLDEAPQLLNVLRGEMSLVGPRPLVRAEQDALGERWQIRRADLRPGLTGRWQVAGRANIPFEDMIKLDYQYVTGWTLARDVEILLATLPAVLSGRGAY